MKVIKPGYEILDDIDGKEVLKKIEKIARVCYKSEDKIKEGSAEKMVKALVKNGHEAMLEHYSFSVKFIVDRGVSHEIVRHRMASFAQESTRYCNYGNGEMTFIEPCYFSNDALDDDSRRIAKYIDWLTCCKDSETCYIRMLNRGATPQEARSVLPNSLKTEIVMTANLREWRHFFKLRAVGVTGKPHPQIKEVAVPLLKELQKIIPVVFDDLEVE
ncbi:MAG: FAD-dependent thymidylate synthase [Candidatus Coprovivens sp.]